MSNTETIPLGAAAPHGGSDPSRVMLRRAGLAAFMGTFVEWFDYASYGFLATIIAVGVLSRDRRPQRADGDLRASSRCPSSCGRSAASSGATSATRSAGRRRLSLSIFIMSASTFVIALLPTYQMVGLWAAVLLLATRLVQGFAASGEYAGAASFLSEYAPDNKRGLMTCLVPAGEAAGLLAASLFVAILHGVLTTEQLHSWGWRLPFLLAFPLGYVGVYIRRKLDETPHFKALEDAHHVPQTPVIELLTKHRREVLIAFGGTPAQRRRLLPGAQLHADVPLDRARHLRDRRLHRLDRSRSRSTSARSS